MVSSNYVSKPSANDVLMGRGGATNNHEGNKMYRQLVQDHQDEYLKAIKRDKKGIAKSIVAIVRGRGGGFLKKADDGRSGWVDVGDKKAWEKTSQALREGLDAKSLLAKGIVKADVLAEVEAQQPPRKRRRRHSNADVATDSDAASGNGAASAGASAQASSPALVSEMNAPYEDVSAFNLGFTAEDDIFPLSDAAFDAVPPPPTSSDVGEIVEI